jgi:hypothetical protein
MGWLLWLLSPEPGREEHDCSNKNKENKSRMDLVMGMDLIEWDILD